MRITIDLKKDKSGCLFVWFTKRIFLLKREKFYLVSFQEEDKISYRFSRHPHPVYKGRWAEFMKTQPVSVLLRVATREFEKHDPMELNSPESESSYQYEP